VISNLLWSALFLSFLSLLPGKLPQDPLLFLALDSRDLSFRDDPDGTFPTFTPFPSLFWIGRLPFSPIRKNPLFQPAGARGAFCGFSPSPPPPARRSCFPEFQSVFLQTAPTPADIVLIAPPSLRFFAMRFFFSLLLPKFPPCQAGTCRLPFFSLFAPWRVGLPYPCSASQVFSSRTRRGFPRFQPSL